MNVAQHIFAVNKNLDLFVDADKVLPMPGNRNGNCTTSVSMTKNDLRLLEQLRKELDFITISETVRFLIRMGAETKLPKEAA